MKLLWTLITEQGRDMLAGYLAGEEEIPLFVICVDVHETTSYHLTGAFVPSRDERELRRQDEFMAGLGKEGA